MKPIIVVRTPNQNTFPIECQREITKAITEKLEEFFIVFVIFNENETDKTTFEIIKTL
jgi:hypothetical protein